MPIPQFTAGQVLTAAELNAMVDAINAGGAVKVAAFTASGTWTVPAGVTYAVAYILAGGGGVGVSSGSGGTSSVAFASGTVSATGGSASVLGNLTGANDKTAAAANSGKGAKGLVIGGEGWNALAQDGALITAGATVTPAASITVTVGAGGVAGTNGAAGGSGYVYIEYQGG
jgi:hypothetical protein